VHLYSISEDSSLTSFRTLRLSFCSAPSCVDPYSSVSQGMTKVSVAPSSSHAPLQGERHDPAVTGAHSVSRSFAWRAWPPPAFSYVGPLKAQDRSAPPLRADHSPPDDNRGSSIGARGECRVTGAPRGSRNQDEGLRAGSNKPRRLAYLGLHRHRFFHARSASHTKTSNSRAECADLAVDRSAGQRLARAEAVRIAAVIVGETRVKERASTIASRTSPIAAQDRSTCGFAHGGQLVVRDPPDGTARDE